MEQDIEGKPAQNPREDGATRCDKGSSKSSTATDASIGADQSTNEKPVIRRHLHGFVRNFKDQWFLVALAALIAIASKYQVGEQQQQIKATIVTYLFVSVIFFVTGCTLSTEVLMKNYARWKLHLFVQVQCFLLTSALFFSIVSACARNPAFMDPGLLIGLIFTGSTATTISSNVVMTGQARGNQALTVVQSTLGNLLGPFLTPALIYMYTSGDPWYAQVLPDENGDFKEIYRRVFKQLGLSVFVPLFVGQVVQNLCPNATKTIFVKYKLSKIGSVCLLIIIWSTYDQAFSSGAFTSVKASNMIFVVFIGVALFSLLLGSCFMLSIFWLSKEDTIAVCYCVPAKTPAMGVPLAHVMFVGISSQLQSKIQIPLVIYQGLQIVGGSLLTIAFRRWITKSQTSQVSG